MEYFECFKEGLKLIPPRLFRFIKKLFCNIFFYGFFIAIPLLISLGGMFLVKVVSQNVEAATLTLQILFTIGQIIPLSMSLCASEKDLIKSDEGSAELCFAICVFVIAYTWNIF